MLCQVLAEGVHLRIGFYALINAFLIFLAQSCSLLIARKTDLFFLFELEIKLLHKNS